MLLLVNLVIIYNFNIKRKLIMLMNKKGKKNIFKMIRNYVTKVKLMSKYHFQIIAKIMEYNYLVIKHQFNRLIVNIHKKYMMSQFYSSTTQPSFKTTKYHQTNQTNQTKRYNKK
jgi:hypothetical protein